MTAIPARLRRRVIERAGHRCEYCRLAQAGQEATFHIDHILPRADDGPTAAANLALACVSCSLRKEARRFGPDPATGKRVTFFHPRRQRWGEHFAWDGVTLVGLTPVGRATVEALRLNRLPILAIRSEEADRGRHPPADE